MKMLCSVSQTSPIRSLRGAVVLAALIVSLAPAMAQAAPRELFPQGDFAKPGVLNKWRGQQPWMKKAFSIQKEGDRSFVRVSRFGKLESIVKLDGSTKSIELSYKVRLANFIHKGGQFDYPSVNIEVKDGAGKKLAGDWGALREDTDWKTVKRTFNISPKARTAKIMVVYKGGNYTLDVADIHLRGSGQSTKKAKPATLTTEELLAMEAKRTRSYPRRGAQVNESVIDVTIHVNQDHPVASDNNDGLSPGQPKKTIQAALDAARPQLAKGKVTKVLIAPGTYRIIKELKAIDYQKGTQRDTLLIVEGAEKGKVIISGSQTAGWEADTWQLHDAEKRIYKHEWKYNWPFTAHGYYSPRQVMLNRREIVYINGKRLEPVVLETYQWDGIKKVYNSAGLDITPQNHKDKGKGHVFQQYLGPDVLKPGEFGVAALGPGEKQYPNHPHPNTIFIRLPEGMDNLDDALIEVGMSKRLMHVQRKNGFVLRNIIFRNNAGYYSSSGWAFEGGRGWHYPWHSKNWLIEDCSFEDNGAGGMALAWVRNVTMRRCHFTRNGNVASYMTLVQDGVVEDSSATYNNWRGERIGYVHHTTAGFDHNTENMLFRRVKATHNYGSGFRVDHRAANNVYEDCVSSFNRAGMGFFFEICKFGPITLRNCTVEGNAGLGMMLLNASNVTVEKSIFAHNRGGEFAFYVSPPRTTKLFYLPVGFKDVPCKDIRNFTLRNSVIIGKGKNGYTITRRYKEGNPVAYLPLLKNEYNASNNYYWNPDTTQVFEKSVDFHRRAFTDFAEFKQITGEEQGSTWGPIDVKTAKRRGIGARH